MPEPRQKPGRSKQDYGTPRDFLTVVVQKFGPIGLDVSASAENAVVPRFYDVSLNGLTQTWWNPDGIAWCNPEFGQCADWTAKAAHEWWSNGHPSLLLVPASVDSNWWARSVHERARVYFVGGRLKFVGAVDVYPKPLALLHYGGTPGYEPWRWRTRT